MDRGSLTNYRTSDPYEVVIGTPVASMNNSKLLVLDWMRLTRISLMTYTMRLIHTMFAFTAITMRTWWSGYLARDTTGGQEVMTCVYSSVNVSFAPPF